MESHTELEILYEDVDMVAINKPHGLLVHRSSIAKDVTEFALQKLRDQINQKVYLVHRLDRKTSGVLLFAKSQTVHRELSQRFAERQVHKIYEAVIRGHLYGSAKMDYALTSDDKTQSAATTYRVLYQYEIDVPLGKWPTSRYTHVELIPETGRFHQLRRHMAHLRHPIIGDRPHGCNKQNRLWKQNFDLTEMLLHAKSLSFSFGDLNKLVIEAPRSEIFQEALDVLSAHSL